MQNRQNRWGFDDAETSESPNESPNVYGQFGRVVPADGDPEVERYQASLRAREQARGRMPRLRSRHPLRNWAITLGAVLLIALFIKPLAVFAAAVALIVLGLILVGLLAAGALLLALRVALGGRVAYYVGRGGAFRRTGRWRR